MKPPRIFVEPDYEAMSRRAAASVDAAIRENPRIVLALPTGNTPVGMYRELVALHKKTGTDWSRVTTFNLDEYLGVGPDQAVSYAAFMREHLFGKVNVSPDRSHLPNGMAPDQEAEAARYEAAIDAMGGIDLAVLGVGANGHVGFNEPAEALTGPTHVAELAAETWRRNFPELARQRNPTQGGQFRRALTVGIGTILRARRILLLASGEEKREVLSRGFSGPIATRLPVSLLQVHPDVTLVLDIAAAGTMRG